MGSAGSHSLNTKVLPILLAASATSRSLPVLAPWPLRIQTGSLAGSQKYSRWAHSSTSWAQATWPLASMHFAAANWAEP